MVILGATVAQLAVGAFASLERFEGKGFGARLVGYPVMMLLIPAVYAGVARARGRDVAIPWAAVAFVMAPFVVDVTGNSLDFYDRLVWWDDANHFGNWVLLCVGVGLLLERADVRPRWLLGVAIGGIGAALAILWELGEWYTFIRHGTELATAYEDTLGDEALGTLGGAVAGYLVAAVFPSRRAAPVEEGHGAASPGAGRPGR